MDDVDKICSKILTTYKSVEPCDVPEHPFFKHVQTLKRKRNQSRLLFPFLYLASGLVLVAVLVQLDTSKESSWEKRLGAVVGVFSAMLGFWQPQTALKQKDCTLLLDLRLPTDTLTEINEHLEISTESFQLVTKLLVAGSSFIAIYLITGN